MTVREMMNVVGKYGGLELAGITVLVRVVDARTCYGRDDLRVEPIGGTGATWVRADSVKLLTGDAQRALAASLSDDARTMANAADCD